MANEYPKRKVKLFTVDEEGVTLAMMQTLCWKRVHVLEATLENNTFKGTQRGQVGRLWLYKI